MNFRTTIVLLVLVIAAGWYLFVFEKNKPASQVSTTIGSEKPLLLKSNFDSEALERITLEQGDQTVVIEKDGNDWMQTKPVRFGVNTWSANQFATTVANLKITDHPREQLALSEIGLSPPLATLSLVSGGKTFTFKIGRKLTIGSRGYLMAGDDPQIHIVTDELHNMVLDGDARDWRKKSLPGIKEGLARRVVLTRDGQILEIVKTDSAWALGSPHQGRVDTQAASDLLGKLDGLLVRDFAVDQPTDLAVYGLASPTTTLRIEPSVPTSQPAGDQAAAVLVLSIGAPTDLKQEKFYASLTQGDKPADIVFIIAKSDKEKFNTQVDDLRDKRVSLIKAADINTIAVERGESAIKLERSEAGWTFAAPAPPFAPDGGAISELLDVIEGARATSFVGSAKPAAIVLATVTLTATGHPEPEFLKIYAHNSDSHLVLRNNETTGRVLAANKLAMLVKPALAWRNHTVIDLKTDDLKNVTITRPDGVKFAFEKSDEAAWQLAGQDKFESADYNALLIYFQPLLAVQWLEAGQIGDKAYHIQLGDQASLTIDAESRAATASGIDGVFQISKSMLDALAIELRHRTVFDFTVDDIKEVAIGDMTLSKKDGKYLSAQTDKLDDSAVGSLFDTLAGLRVKRYLAADANKTPTRTMSIVMNDDTALSLQLTGENQGSIGDLGFELSQEDYNKLTAKLISEK